MKASAIEHQVKQLPLADGAWHGPRLQVGCTGCDWVGDRFHDSDHATIDFRRHQRLLAGEKGIYECGCSPDDWHPLLWRKLGRRKQCLAHRKPYIPKSAAKPKAPPLVSTEQILEALRRKHMDVSFDFQRPWFFTTELRMDTGFAGDSRRGGQRVVHRQLCDSKCSPRVDDHGRPMLKRVHGNATRLDAFAMHMWRSGDFERVAYEVKVSREDFLNEIRKPWKREPGMAVSNRFFYVTPTGLLKPEEVPEGCGLMEVGESLKVRTKVKAPWRDQPDPPIGFTVSIIRRVQKELEKGPAS